ncbi:MAG TPA: acyl-CoA dehydrogenase family protein [Jatrophihabitans sp.]|jgi:alkylation response protein AidB-like acyl-CoA dehydrogenase|nr:acyl-CoA dehydrogenase family protein [Jatrophihabitans sp.]
MAMHLTAGELPAETETLRREVRDFVAAELAAGNFTPRCDNWLGGVDREFSRKLGGRGWLGMTWPREYGGQERSALDRFVVTEELLAAGAPVAAHWVADRQVGPLLLRFGTEAQRQRYLPSITKGECCFAIGMSEPDSGSDLASVRTRAEQVPGGWRVNGTKVWTSAAQVAQAMIALVRTSPADGDRHAGLTQLIIELGSDGVTVNPITSIDGQAHFNEVVLRDVFVPDDAVVGELGAGWRQVTAELAYERSGPERILSTMPLLRAWCRQLASHDASGEARHAAARLVARAWVLRQLSLAVASALAAGEAPAVEAALVKDLGTRFEQESVAVIRRYAAVEPDPDSTDDVTRLLGETVLRTPAFTLRGGTNEILRGIVARSLVRQ